MRIKNPRERLRLLSELEILPETISRKGPLSIVSKIKRDYHDHTSDGFYYPPAMG